MQQRQSKQILNIQELSKYGSQIDLSNLDALEVVRARLGGQNTLMYLDPPYYIKGSKLYKNFYTPSDHAQIAQELASRRDACWIVTYDDVDEIRQAYSSFHPIAFSPNYSAGQKSIGREVMFLSDALLLPIVHGFQRAA